MRKLLLTIATSALMATGAIAADPVITVDPAYVEPSTGFDWDGFYMGVGLSGSSLSNGIVTDTTGYLDLIAGFNVTSGDMLFGLEGWVGAYSDGTNSGWSGGAEVRAGYLISPDALLYVSGGAQFYDAGARYATLGAGAEFAATDNLTLDVEYKYWGWSNNGFTGHSLGLSALWHF